MKKIYLITTLFCAIVGVSNAQTLERNDIQITLGAGYSLIGLVFASDLDINGSGVNSSGTPVINGMVDFALLERFTFGLAASYQGYSVEYTDVANPYKESWSCLNIGLRPLYHFSKDERLDAYVGARISRTFWNFDSTSDGSNIPSVSLPGLGLQPLLGINYYITKNIGFNAEVGIGTYLVAGGLSIKL